MNYHVDRLIIVGLLYTIRTERGVFNLPSKCTSEFQTVL